MAERYRDLQRQSLLETGLVQDNAGSASARLANVFKQFESQASERLGLLRAQKGEQEGAAAGEEAAEKKKNAIGWNNRLVEFGVLTPEAAEQANDRVRAQSVLRTGLRATTAYGRAYNNAALRSYVIKAEADAEETAARLEVDSGTDPEKFRTTFGRVRDEMLKTAEPGVRAALGEVYNRRLGAGLQRIEFARAREVRAEQRATTSEGIGRAIDRIGQLRATDDPAAFAEAEEEEVKLNLLIDGAMADGTLSRTEAEALHLDAARGVVKKTVTARFAREFDSPYGDPIGFIERLREANKNSEALPPEEEAKLQDELLAELRERNALRNARESMVTDELRLRYLEGDRQATEALLNGTLTQRQLLQMIEANKIDPADARTLLNELQSAPAKAHSDPQELFNVETNLLSFDEKEIATNRALSWADRSRLISKRRDESAGWKGTQQAKEGADRIDRALGLVPGMSTKTLSTDEARQRDTALTEWYQLVDALPPEERQFKAIELAEQVTTRVIKRNANEEVEQIRGRIARMKETYGDPEKLSGKKRKEFDDELRRQEARLREAEQKAK